MLEQPTDDDWRQPVTIAKGVKEDLCDLVTGYAAEINQLRKFVQFVADCSNDPSVRAEAIKMGARP